MKEVIHFKLTILGSGQIVADFITMAGDLADTELVSIFGTEQTSS